MGTRIPFPHMISTKISARRAYEYGYCLRQEILEEILGGNESGRVFVGTDNISTFDFHQDFCSQSIKYYSFARNL